MSGVSQQSAKRQKHIPLRRCVVCRSQRPQAELLRFSKDSEGQWQFDESKKSGGRGAWVCTDKPACHQQKKLGRFFRAQADTISKQLSESSDTIPDMEV